MSFNSYNLSPIVFDKPLILDIPLYIVLVFLSQANSLLEYLNLGFSNFIPFFFAYSKIEALFSLLSEKILKATVKNSKG